MPSPTQSRTARPIPRARGRDRLPGAGDGTMLLGPRLRGAEAGAVGEVCFNTGMTGYQETLTDPSYAGQIITFTFPHIGNVGTNARISRLSPPPPAAWW